MKPTSAPSAFSRRDFCRTVGVGASAALLGGCSFPGMSAKRRLKIGHTGITWTDDEVLTAIRELGALGYEGFEPFSWVAEPWEAKGSLAPHLREAKLPLISEYCSIALHDPTRRKAEIDKLVGFGRTIKKLGGTVAVVGPSTVPNNRAGFDFAVSKNDIITTLNEVSKQLTDIGIIPALHPHTGTSIMTRDEVYAVLERADTKVVKFCPDVGQLAKAGADPVQIVKDFLPLVRHAHVKDFNGGESFLGYCPLGQGRVDIAGIMDLLEKADMKVAMVELDSSRNMPISAGETAKIAKSALQKLGYSFRV
ncbi:MAG: sugar phosphate isomerase/epimerase [Opitutaceae bacterium]